MTQYFHKPENALKRANELINTPNASSRQKTSALEYLHDELTPKRNKTWQPVHQDIMILYLDICIESRQGRIAKDGLHQYRNLTLQQNPVSLEFIIHYFIAKTEKCASLARSYSSEVALAVDDLEANETPEAMLLSTTTSESSRDRTDRNLVVPWLRFLWDAYRTVLDILKFNTKMENLYYTLTYKAYAFCLEYKRKIEFRRLCEVLRSHLGIFQRHLQQPNAQSTRQLQRWDGWTSESVELHLKIRYEQLEVATELENWSEGFRTIEDIHAVMGLINKAPKVALMATYYEKLTQIFWVSKNYLFHAHAWLNFYKLSKKHNTTLSDEALTVMASSVMLASLSIPLIEEGRRDTTSLAHLLKMESGAAGMGSDVHKEKTQRMATLMGFMSSSKREDLLNTLLETDILQHVLPNVSTIFTLLEQKFDPLEIAASVKPLLEQLNGHPTLQQYVPALETLLVQRLIKQLTTVYSSVTIAYFKSLITGLKISYHQVEQLIVRSVQNGFVQVKIDHRKGCLRFGDMTLESKVMATQLTTLGRKLNDFVKMIQPQDKDDALTTMVSIARLNLAATNSRLLTRKVTIEKQKEDIERLQQEKSKNQNRRREETEKQRRGMESARLEQESKRREQDKRQRIKDEIALKETKQLFERLGRDTEGLDISNLEHVDKDTIVREAKEKAARTKEDAQKKLRDQAKRLDYIVRATREVELLILKKAYDDQCNGDQELHGAKYAQLLETTILDHKFAMTQKLRMCRMVPMTSVFEQRHVERQRIIFTKRFEENRLQKKMDLMGAKLDRARERYGDEQERLQKEEDDEKRRVVEEEAAVQRRAQEEVARKQQEARTERVVKDRAARESALKDQEAARAQSEAQAQARDEKNNNTWKASGSRAEPSSRLGDNDDWQHVGRPDSAQSTAPTASWRGRSKTDRRIGSERKGPTSTDRRFGGDEQSRFSSSRDGDRFGLGGDRSGGDRIGSSRPSDRDGGDRREGGFGSSRPSDRDGGDRIGSIRPSTADAGGSRWGRDTTRRDGGGDRQEGMFSSSRPSDRDGGDRREGFGSSRPSDRDGGDRREGGFGSTRPNDREGGDRIGSSRPSTADGGERRRDGRDSGAPESGRWRK